VASGIKSAKLKLVRAKKHLRRLKRCTAAYAASKPHKIVSKPKRKKKLNVPNGPPLEIAVLAGEIVYQIRSALDHLAFELVKTNPAISTIDPNWEKNTQFPLRTTVPKTGRPVCRGIFANSLPGISDAAFAIIEPMQPYHGLGAVNNSLRLLERLSNIDKHRHLHLIRPRPTKREVIRFRSGSRASSFHTLNRGAIIEPVSSWNRSDKPVYVKRSYGIRVSFNERSELGEATDVPVEDLLELVLQNVTAFVVPALEALIKNP
jgi:hypothetical protein